MNDHEVNTECLRLLREGPPLPAAEGAFAGHGFLPLALDVDGDVAVVTVLSTGSHPDARADWFIDGWTFHRRAGEWMALGGGGGAAPHDPLARRPSQELGRALRRYGTGRTVRNADRLLPWGAKWVNQVRLRAAAEVEHIRVGRRLLAVPAHGHVAVVWSQRRAPLIEALDADGGVLDVLDLEPHHATVPDSV